MDSFCFSELLSRSESSRLHLYERQFAPHANHPEKRLQTEPELKDAIWRVPPRMQNQPHVLATL